MSEILRNRHEMLRKWALAPVPVLIAGTAMIGIHTLGFLLLLHELGFDGLSAFISDSVQNWDSMLLCIASVALLSIEIACGLAVIQGKNWGRWGYLSCQITVIGYMLLASLGWFHPEMFSVNGETGSEIFAELVRLKIPEIMILALLFIPLVSRRYFGLQNRRR